MMDGFRVIKIEEYKHLSKQIEEQFQSSIEMIQNKKSYFDPQEKEVLYKIHFGDKKGLEYNELLNNSVGKAGSGELGDFSSSKEIEMLAMGDLERELTKRTQQIFYSGYWKDMLQRHYILQELFQKFH